MTPNNPLTKYFRQPKIFIQLPSKGLHYPPGVLKGDYNNVPIFGMTGMDEILFKTPDALFNGEASSKVIESCCPFISNAKLMPSIDVDAVLVAIRVATYGENMSISYRCGNCGEESDYDVDLKPIIDYFSSIDFDSLIKINDEISVKVRPLTYKEITEFGIENFKLQRMLYQIESLSETEQQEHLTNVYKRLGEIQVELFMLSIDSVHIPDATVTDKDQIKEWLQNSDKTIYKIIKDQLDFNKTKWSIPKQHLKCVDCGAEHDVAISVDQSNFFG